MQMEVQTIPAKPTGGTREGSLAMMKLNRWNPGEVYLLKAYFSMQAF